MRQNLFGLDRIDLLVIAVCGLTFVTAIAPHGHAPPGPPTAQAIEKMAEELGVTADQLRHATEIVPPPARGEHFSPERRDKARQTFAAVLNVPVERVDMVMRRHHPPPHD